MRYFMSRMLTDSWPTGLPYRASQAKLSISRYFDVYTWTFAYLQIETDKLSLCSPFAAEKGESMSEVKFPVEHRKLAIYAS